MAAAHCTGFNWYLCDLQKILRSSETLMCIEYTVAKKREKSASNRRLLLLPDTAR